MSPQFRTIIVLAWSATARAADPWLTVESGSGPGQGKQVVFVTGEEEYRSEESAPMLARLLSERHGFKTTVLFAITKFRGKDKDKDKNAKGEGEINPNITDNIPGLSALQTADMMVMMLRFRELRDADMEHIVNFVREGKPILAVRTSTHAFAYTMQRDSRYAAWDWQSRRWPGGFGQQIVGATWVRHHGDHGKESTRGVIEPGEENHPLLRGVRDVWGPSDVYGVDSLPASARILLRGRVLAGVKPDSPPAAGAKNDPMQPLVWVNEYRMEGGKPGRVIASTIGAAADLECADLRRLFVNAIYFGCGLEVPGLADVEPAGEYKPSPSGFNKFKRGMKPSDLQNPAP
jgi:hypothetical protein